MALALLDLVDFDDDGSVRFAVDTGTNTEFEIRVGPDVVNRAGTEFVDPVTFTTRRAHSASDGSPLASSSEHSVRVPPGRDARYAQLFSWKANRKAPTFSDVVELPPAMPDFAPVRRRPLARAHSIEVQPMNGTALARSPVRTLSRRELASPATVSFDTLLDAVIKLAQPVVAEALKSPPGAAANTDPGSPAGIIAQLLGAVLGAMPGATPPAVPAATTKSLEDARFGHSFSRDDIAQPFIFGIDDVLIGAAIGQVVQILPQLANAANQKAKDRQQANTTIVTEALKGINQRLMMERILQAQRDAQAATAAGQPTLSPTDLATLADLAAKIQAAESATASPATAITKSLSVPPAGAAPASRAILEPLTAKPLAWIGGEDLLYARKSRIALRYRLTVGAPTPTKPLARAILKVVLADERSPAARVEKEVRLTDLRPGAEIECIFEPAELSTLPSGARLTATGALRWPGAKGRTVEALGSSKMVLVGPAFVAGTPAEVGPEREPVDMQRWRPFWNKIWEARQSSGPGRRWKLDVALRYTVIVDADERNGIIEPRLKSPAEKPESAYDLTTGRMKAGVEFGVPRLIELRQLWDLKGPAQPDQVEALSDRAFLATLGGEMTEQLELSGRSSERGMVWAIPTFRLFSVPLSRVTSADAQGCVTAVEETKLEVPLPTAMRVIGLISS